jgi:hypothetical protein
MRAAVTVLPGRMGEGLENPSAPEVSKVLYLFLRYGCRSGRSEPVAGDCQHNACAGSLATVGQLEGEPPASGRQLPACQRVTRRGGRGTGAMPLAVHEVPSTGVFEEPRGVNEVSGTLAGGTPRTVEPAPRGDAVDGRHELGRGPRVHPCRSIACTRQGIGQQTSWCTVAPGGPIRRGTRR